MICWKHFAAIVNVFMDSYRTYKRLKQMITNSIIVYMGTNTTCSRSIWKIPQNNKHYHFLIRIMFCFNTRTIHLVESYDYLSFIRFKTLMSKHSVWVGERWSKTTKQDALTVKHSVFMPCTQTIMQYNIVS